MYDVGKANAGDEKSIKSRVEVEWVLEEDWSKEVVRFQSYITHLCIDVEYGRRWCGDLAVCFGILFASGFFACMGTRVKSGMRYHNGVGAIFDRCAQLQW